MDINKVLKSIGLALLFYVLLFQNVLEGLHGSLANIDEAIFVVIVIASIIKLIFWRKSELDSRRKNIILAMIFILIIGVAGNLVYEYQLAKYAAKDAILMFKGLAVFTMLPVLVSDFDIDEYVEFFNIQLKLVSVFLFVVTIANIFFKFLPSNEVRFGIPTQQLWFSHPTYLVSVGVVIIAMLSVFMKSHKENWKYVLLMSVVMVATGRTKAILFLALYLYIAFIVIVKERKLNKKDFIILAALGCVFAVSEIITYLTHIYWARSAVTVGSLNVAMDHFPIGTGFGTFGNWVSGENYSPVYYKYGMEVVPGLRPDFYEFIADTFWPMLLGQFGIGGLAIYVYIIITMYLDINDNDDLYNYLGQLSLFAYLLVASLAEASFSGPVSVLCFGLIVILGKANKKLYRS